MTHEKNSKRRAVARKFRCLRYKLQILEAYHLRESPDPTPEKILKGVWLRSRGPVNFWPLNGNSSKMAKVMNFTIENHAPKEVPT